ncbi:hypothetical protein PRUB_b0409 [Pseudoalteromonas rubra]|uniref:Uncharacterized protein n=2 Tax=Pseudoalteromonas rubra TaxID=43658 RepID=A0A8T0BZ25_9GAMM|nr:hypothetical protein PRUB_b0409 [Pseudoalteromonas rubra]
MIKPTVILVLVFTIVGYIFCQRHYVTKPTFQKTSGYHTFILSASWGFALYMVAIFIFGISAWVLELSGFPQGVIAPTLKHTVELLFPGLIFPSYSIHCILISAIALILSVFGPNMILNITAKQKNVTPEDLKNAVYFSLSGTDDTPEFTGILHNSMLKGLPIAFTLSNRKVYIGYVINLGYHMNDFMVLPLKSGYRCKDELRLELVTNYASAWSDIEASNKDNPEANQSDEEELDLEKFLINIPVREVVHANLHDFEYKEHFEKHEKPRSASRPSKSTDSAQSDNSITL